MIFGTLGRINEFLTKGLIDVSDLCYIVIDEFDQMLEDEVWADLEQFLNSIKSLREKSKNPSEIISQELMMKKGTALYW